MSDRYLGDLRVRLGRFVNCFGEEMIAQSMRVKLTNGCEIGRRRSHAQYVSSAAGRSFQFCQTAWLHY